MNEAHIIQIPELDIFLAHGHDEESHMFIAMLLQAARDERVQICEEQAVFPLDSLSRFCEMAEDGGITVVEGEDEE